MPAVGMDPRGIHELPKFLVHNYPSERCDKPETTGLQTS